MGDGKLMAWATFHRRYFSYLPTPYIVAAVQIDEGLLVCGGLRVPTGSAPFLDAPVKLEVVEAELPDGRSWATFDWVMTGKDAAGISDGQGEDHA